MKELRKKLNSQSGAVFVIALIFFLVCVVVGAIVVTAATMNAGRTEKRYDEQQAYLAASSAVQMLQENFADMTFSAEREEWIYTCGYSDSSHASPLEKRGMHEWKMTKAVSDTVCINEFITESAMEICERAEASSVIGEHIKEYTLEADKIKNVTTTVSVQIFDSNEDSKKYDIKCIVNSRTDGGTSYTMSLYIDAAIDASESRQENNDADMHVETSTTDLEWDSGKQQWVYKKTNAYYDYTVVTHRQNVTWAEGSIEKGGKL